MSLTGGFFGHELVTTAVGIGTGRALFERTYQRDNETFEDTISRIIDENSIDLEPPQLCTLTELVPPCDKV